MKILCIDVGAATIQYGLIEDGRDCFYERSEMPTRGREGAEAVLKRLCKIIERYADAIDCISICTRGRIREDTRQILFSTADIPGWGGFPLVEKLEESFHLPVVLLNDTTALALGEAHFGSMRGQKSFLCMNIGAGIGGVVVRDGQVLGTGPHRAAEMGHLTLHPDGKRCACGRQGCYEAYASAHALIRTASCRLRKRTLTGRELFSLIEKGDDTARECLESWAGEVALGLYNICCVVNPETVVLGGGLMQQKAALCAIRTQLDKLECHVGVMPAQVLSSALGSTAGLYGCVVAAREKMAKAESIAE